MPGGSDGSAGTVPAFPVLNRAFRRSAVPRRAVLPRYSSDTPFPLLSSLPRGSCGSDRRRGRWPVVPADSHRDSPPARRDGGVIPVSGYAAHRRASRSMSFHRRGYRQESGRCGCPPAGRGTRAAARQDVTDHSAAYRAERRRAGGEDGKRA